MKKKKPSRQWDSNPWPPVYEAWALPRPNFLMSWMQSFIASRSQRLEISKTRTSLVSDANDQELSRHCPVRQNPPLPPSRRDVDDDDGHARDGVRRGPFIPIVIVVVVILFFFNPEKFSRSGKCRSLERIRSCSFFFVSNNFFVWIVVRLHHYKVKVSYWRNFCGTVVEHKPLKPDIAGLESAECWAFFIHFYPFKILSLCRCLKKVQHHLCSG